jgi:hypothetical protein
MNASVSLRLVCVKLQHLPSGSRADSTSVSISCTRDVVHVCQANMVRLCMCRTLITAAPALAELPSPGEAARCR